MNQPLTPTENALASVILMTAIERDRPEPLPEELERLARIEAYLIRRLAREQKGVGGVRQEPPD